MAGAVLPGAALGAWGSMDDQAGLVLSTAFTQHGRGATWAWESDPWEKRVPEGTGCSRGRGSQGRRNAQPWPCVMETVTAEDRIQDRRPTHCSCLCICDISPK